MKTRDNRFGSHTQSQQFFLVAQELQKLAHPIPVEFAQKRRQNRQLRTLSISVQPLNEDFQNEGDKFWVVSRDISLRGIGLISHESLQHEYVRLGLMSETVNVIGNVRHNTSIGQEYPLFLVGVEFLEETEFG